MRRTPQQARSRHMVERLVAAARAVLVEQGYDAFTTNRVAAHAGVSPGSLYQYFPDKDALLAAVVDRFWDDVAERVTAALADRLADDAGPAMIRATATALVDALDHDVELLRIAHDLPSPQLRARLVGLERRVQELAAAYLGLHARHLPRDRVAGTAWVLVMAAENLVVRWVLDRPEALTRERLVSELVRLAGSYVMPPDGAPSGATTGPGTPRGAPPASPARPGRASR